MPENETARFNPEQTPRRPAGRDKKTWLLVVLLAILSFIIVKEFTRREHANGASGPGVSWSNDYQQALQTAQEQKKPLLLAFHASWCGFCNKMKETTYRDPAVVQKAASFIPIMIDTDRQPALSQKYQVDVIPAYRIVTPAGKILASFEGYQPPDEFIESLQAGLEKAS